MGKSNSRKWEDKRNLSTRYGEDLGQYRRPGQDYGQSDNPGNFDERVLKKAQNDYDTRKTQETLHLALTDKDYYNTLGKKSQNFVDNYKGGDKKDKDGLTGISNMKELQAINDFGKLYHKHERGNGGEYSSANDYAGGSMAMMDSVRQFHSRNFASKDDLIQQAPEDAAQTANSLLPDNYTPSPQLERAQNLVKSYEDGILKSGSGEVSSGALGEFSTDAGVADDATEASDATAKAQSFLQSHTLNLKDGFKKYGISTRGENSTASKNDELMKQMGW